MLNKLKKVGVVGGVGVVAAIAAVLTFALVNFDTIQKKHEVNQVVGDHYEAIDDRKFEQAYNYFHPKEMKRQGRLREWGKQKESEKIRAIRIYHLEAFDVEGENSQVEYEFLSVDKRGSHCFKGTWVLKEQYGDWKMFEPEAKVVEERNCELGKLQNWKASLNEIRVQRF
jgi:hypothetical protein